MLLLCTLLDILKTVSLMHLSWSPENFFFYVPCLIFWKMSLFMYLAWSTENRSFYVPYLIFWKLFLVSTLLDLLKNVPFYVPCLIYWKPFLLCTFPDLLKTVSYRVFIKNCVFSQFTATPPYIAVRDLQSSQRNASLQ